MSLRILLPFALSILVGCAAPTDDDDDGAPVEPTGATANALAADITIYGDSMLTKPWSNWSWGADAQLNDTTTPRTSGSNSQIKATSSRAWGALSLARSAGDFPTATYDSITFDVRAATSTKVYFFIESLNGGPQGAKVTIPVSSGWSHQSISLDGVRAQLGSFGKINFMLEHAGETIFVDNVALVARGTSVTLPTKPISVAVDKVVGFDSGKSAYYMYVPKAYDTTHRTPSRLLVWLHGCGGYGEGDTWSVSPGGTQQGWVTISLGGRDGGCWDVDQDMALVMQALSDVKARLNIDPKRVVVGGYSSGGDLAYRTAFYNSLSFAGVIAENTSPFRDTESSPSASLAAAKWKFNVAHLAHLQDTTYPIDTVRNETGQLQKAGYPIERLEKSGDHWDNDTTSGGTQKDRRTYLLPYLDRGWTAP